MQLPPPTLVPQMPVHPGMIPQQQTQQMVIPQSAEMSGRGRMILLAGPPGSGKTTLAANFTPGQTYFIIDPAETGVYDLMESRQISIQKSMIHDPFKQWNNLLYFLYQISITKGTIPQNVLTIVVESVTGLEQQAANECCSSHYQGNWGAKGGGFANFQNGYETTANNYWVKLLDQLSQLREIGYNIILTGHSEIANRKNPDGPDYMVETLRCNQKYIWPITHARFENIFFLSYDIEAEKENDPKYGQGRGKAKNFRKVLYVNKTPYQDAKNRCGMINHIDADCSATELYGRLCQSARWNPKTLRY